MTSDNEAITDVLIRYATAVDRRDWALFRTCFAADAVADYGDIGRWDDVDGLVAFMVKAHVGLGATNHMLSNLVIDVDGDRASATTYVHAVLVSATDQTQWIDTVGQYRDELRRDGAGWHIVTREFLLTRMLST